MNWFKKLFGTGDKVGTDIHGLPYVKSSTPMPKMKPIKGSDISEPVFAMIESMKTIPHTWKVEREEEKALVRFKKKSYNRKFK